MSLIDLYKTLPLGLRYFIEADAKFQIPPNQMGDQLVLPNGLPQEVQKLSAMGWNVTVPVSLGALCEVWRCTPDSKGNWFQVQDCLNVDEWNVSKVDAVVLSWYFSQIEDSFSVFSKLKNALLGGGRLFLHVENADYCHRQIKFSSRDIYPWPKNLPGGMANSLDKFKGISSPDFELQDVQEVLDESLANSPEAFRWNVMNGFDTAYEFPNENESRKKVFVKSWWIEYKRKSEKIISHEIDEDAVRAQAEKQIVSGKIEEADLLIEDLFNQGSRHCDTWNLKGIIHYYREQWDQAWTCFKEAFSLDSSNEDIANNLLDLAIKTNRNSMVEPLIQRSNLNENQKNKILSELSGM